MCMAAMVVAPAMMRLTTIPTPVIPSSMTTHSTKPQAGGERKGAKVPLPSFATKPEAAVLREAGVVPATHAETEPLLTQPGQAHPSVSAVSPARVAAAADQAYLADLAAHCVLGDAGCWELLVRHEQRRVYGLCYRFTGSVAEAEDLTQEVFLKVYRNLRSFDAAKASFGVWLTALTRNLLVDHYRQSRLERASESLDEPMGGEDDGRTRADRLQDTRAGQEHHIAGLELRAKVQAALAKVSPDLREAVILRDLEDMDYREIAAMLFIPQGTVKSRISRGRSELARLLKDVEGQVV